MDETLHELVSRYVDGDLEDAESARLEARAEHDSELAAAIEASFELRGAVASIAAGMEPPAALDRVMEPLRQSAPAPVRSVRPVYRWLGAAAAVVLGVSVAVEVARRNPEPTLRRPNPSPSQQARERDEIFELAPLPTAVPDENRPLGAADHLLEEQPPQPAAPEPAPLEVVGPLRTGSTTTAADDTPRSGESLQSPALEATAEGDSAAEASIGSFDERAVRQDLPDSAAKTGEAPPAPAKAIRSAAAEDRLAVAGAAGQERAKADAQAGRHQDAAPEVVVRIAGAEYRTGVRVRCTAGVRQVRIEVVGSTVVAIEPSTQAADGVSDDGCRLDGVVGSKLAGVGDGVHLAEVVIGGPAS